jgi:alkylation response protein AidB-like acyl-CoA dehydrogenase
MSLAPWNDEHEMFRKTVREFAQKELAPHAEEWETAGIFPRELFKSFADMGFFGITFPEEVGGLGLDWWYNIAYLEELQHSRNAGLNMGMFVQSDIATPIINEIGTQEQKEEFLMPAIKGERIAALGVTEPDAGSDVASIRTTAKRVGDDYVINGAKTYITNGTRADFITLAVRTGEDGYGGVSLMLFPTDTKGYECSKSLKKLGNWSSDTGLLFFDDCKVPARCLLGQENHGFYYIMTGFQGERLVAAAAALGGMDLMVKDAMQYAKERKAFGRPIIGFQVWRHKLVDLMTKIEAGRWLTYSAVDKFVKGEPCITEISMAKLYTADLANQVAYECLQIHGGAGYMAEYDIARAYRDVRLLPIGAGTSEVMKEIISKAVGM